MIDLRKEMTLLTQSYTRFFSHNRTPLHLTPSMNNTQDTHYSSDEESIDTEEIVIQGFRTTRSRTNFRYRGTAMTTTDSMDIDQIRLQIHDYESVLAHVASAFATFAVIARTRAMQNLPIQQLKKAMDYLSMVVSWITCYLQLLYMDIEDRIYYVQVERPLPEEKLRSITELLDDNQSNMLFGFKILELQLLYQHWRLPQMFREDARLFTGEEAMLVFLFHIRSGMNFIQMAEHVFGGDPRHFSYFIRAMVRHLYNTFYHKISGDSMRQWIPYVDEFRTAIWEKLQNGIVNERLIDGSEANWEVWIPLEQFRIFGLLDDTDLQTNRPRPGRTIENGNEITELRDTQQAFYK